MDSFLNWSENLNSDPLTSNNLHSTPNANQSGADYYNDFPSLDKIMSSNQNDMENIDINGGDSDNVSFNNVNNANSVNNVGSFNDSNSVLNKQLNNTIIRKSPLSINKSLNYNNMPTKSSNPPTPSSFKNSPSLSTNNNVTNASTGNSNSSVNANSFVQPTIERKRRDNINEKIQELGTIIPRTFFEDSKEKSSGTKDGRPNKGQILTKSVEYIRYLQDKIDEQNKLENELIITLKNLENRKNIKPEARPSNVYFKNTSAEMALGKIGVGPLASKSMVQIKNQNNYQASNSNSNGNSNSNSNGSNNGNQSNSPNSISDQSKKTIYQNNSLNNTTPVSILPLQSSNINQNSNYSNTMMNSPMIKFEDTSDPNLNAKSPLNIMSPLPPSTFPMASSNSLNINNPNTVNTHNYNPNNYNNNNNNNSNNNSNNSNSNNYNNNMGQVYNPKSEFSSFDFGI